MGIYNYVYMEMCEQALYMQIIGSVYRMIALFPYLNFVFFFLSFIEATLRTSASCHIPARMQRCNILLGWPESSAIRVLLNPNSF